MSKEMKLIITIEKLTSMLQEAHHDLHNARLRIDDLQVGEKDKPKEEK